LDVARPRSFDETEVIAKASELFAALGYSATSIDELVAATGLQRGSLYKAFGSKQKLFELVLRQSVLPGFEKRPKDLDILIIALKELASTETAIAEICRAAIGEANDQKAQLLGNRLLENLN
jgi:TetR/AcrR family transcriptional repressor of nem operon